MGNNGTKEQIDQKGYSLETTIGTPLFEKDLLTPSADVMAAIRQSYFPDEERLINACLYIAKLEMFDLEEEKTAALYRVNGNTAISARNLRYAVQAHGGLYWPDESTKEEKKFLAKQFKAKDQDEEKAENIRE